MSGIIGQRVWWWAGPAEPFPTNPSQHFRATRRAPAQFFDTRWEGCVLDTLVQPPAAGSLGHSFVPSLVIETTAEHLDLRSVLGVMPIASVARIGDPPAELELRVPGRRPVAGAVLLQPLDTSDGARTLKLMVDQLEDSEDGEAADLVERWRAADDDDAHRLLMSRMRYGDLHLLAERLGRPMHELLAEIGCRWEVPEGAR